MTFPAEMIPLQRATLDARKRLNDKSIGTHVQAGRLQIVRVTYNEKGRSTVTPVSGWLTMTEVIGALDAL